MSDLTLEEFANLVANLYRDEPDDCAVTLGDWKPSPVEGRPEIFHATVRFTVADFRRWAGIRKKPDGYTRYTGYRP